MARKIVITSGKGGVGKTTIAVNLSCCLSKTGARVVLCDADFGLNNADIVAGVENMISYDIVDVIEGRCRAKQALVRIPDYPNLYLLSSSHSAPERYVSPQSLKIVLDGLSPSFDFIIIDCPAGIDEGFHRAVASAEEAIVVTTPNLSSIRDGDKVVTLLKSYRLKEISLVVNRAKEGDELSVKEVEALLKIPLLGVLPEREDLREIAPTRPYYFLAKNLSSEKKRLYDPMKKHKRVWRRILEFFVGG